MGSPADLLSVLAAPGIEIPVRAWPGRFSVEAADRVDQLLVAGLGERAFVVSDRRCE